MNISALDTTLDAMLYLSGLTNNPSEEAAKQVLKEQSGTKLQNDVKKATRLFRERVSKMAR